MKKVVYLVLMFALVACSGTKKSEEPSLKDQVMGVHDEVMPKMGEMRKTQKQLLMLADSAGADSLIAVKYRQLATEIKIANESMMSWMRNFDPNYEGTPDEVKAYLETQLKDIEEVKTKMLESLEAGSAAITPQKEGTD